MTGENPGKTERVERQLETLASSPELFLRDIDPGRNAAILTPMSEDSYRRSSFLDNRIVREGDKDIVLPAGALIRILKDSDEPPGTINYIFHVGHCGSTLIARLLGELGDFHALREPAVLMGLSRSYRALERPGFDMTMARWQVLRDLALALLARKWHARQTALVKPTSHAGNLIPQLMSHTGSEKALFLYLDLETYLVTMLRSHTRNENQLYAREFRIREFASLAPSRSAQFGDYPDAFIAALTWLLHTREFSIAIEDPDIVTRSLSMSFDEFLSDPPHQLGRICEFLGSAVDHNTLQRLCTGSTARSHAKSPELDFSAEKRVAELGVAREKSSDEIRAGLAWAARVCSEEPVFAGLIERFSPHIA
jgi:hypothetical protein